ncbi:class I SAM-dependent methyltransferase [Candidatus Magnetobacterium casense]|uniref:Class I SAM-dependent methyltransferase n=1 Tax=Candidatus Magnetobacterium casense TaxID=1455061 RepID=A0ABS6RWN3_9BACT|nr:class I SAM-dependent methyltransferase [Candidatus Magnetobacterium casensis]MBV6341044.1 class I SAM-dependent methyltransferase [Candidatus Magnetobacterium casensis]
MDYSKYWIGVDKSAYHKRRYWHIREAVRANISGRVLDVGGGNGQLLEYFGVKRADIADISVSAKNDKFNYIECDLNTCFPGGTYDTIIVSELLEHIKNPAKIIANAYEHLCDNGKVILIQPNMRADGEHHLHRLYPKDCIRLMSDMRTVYSDYVPAFIDQAAIIDDIFSHGKRKSLACLALSLLPWVVKYVAAHIFPERFALMTVIIGQKAE